MCPLSEWQPLHLIGTMLAVKRSWHNKLPEHMLRFAKVALCALIGWAEAFEGHATGTLIRCILQENGWNCRATPTRSFLFHFSAKSTFFCKDIIPLITTQFGAEGHLEWSFGGENKGSYCHKSESCPPTDHWQTPVNSREIQPENRPSSNIAGWRKPIQGAWKKQAMLGLSWPLC